MRLIRIAMTVLALLTPTLAWSFQTQDPEPQVLDDVTVTGRDPRGMLPFIDGLTSPARHGSLEGQLARWTDPVCVRVIGGWHAVNVAMAERISEVVRSLNIRTGDERCRPNVMVVIAADTEGFAGVFADRYRNRFFDNRRADVDAFTTRPRAVRWHHRIGTGGTDRAPLIDTSVAGLGGQAAVLPNSRLRRGTSEKIERAILVIDPERIRDVPTASLASYLALALLIDLKPFPDTGGSPSILTLFDGDPETAPAGLTKWDRAFVQGLYAMSTDQRVGVQRLEIERAMRRSMANEAREPSTGDAE